MPENDGDGDSSSFSESGSLGVFSLVQSVDLAASIPQLLDHEDNDREGHGSDHLEDADTDVAPPPLGVKLTGYRLLFMTTVFSFGTVKGILTYMGQSIAPNTLDWVSGTFLAVVLYWIGLFEERDSNKWRWFFQVDLSHAIGYYAKRVFGGVVWPLIFLGKALRNFVRRMWLFLQVDYALAISYFAKRVAAGFVWFLLCFDNSCGIICLSILLTTLGGYIQARYFPHVPLRALGVALLVYFGVGFCVWLARIKRVRVPGWDWEWEWEHAMRFVHKYGPNSTPAEEYVCVGEVGTFVGFFCAVAFLLLPFLVILLCFHFRHR